MTDEATFHDDTRPLPPGISDTITTLMARPVFNIALAKEIHRSVRYRHPLALILFEVDGFAGITETHGCGVADLVLERLGIFIQRFFRQPDWVARYRVSAIAVLLPETGARDARALAEGARQAIAERLVFADSDERAVRVTVSASAVTITIGTQSAVESRPIDALRVMVEAEAGVERAKARGGNTVECVEVARDSLSVGETAAYLGCSPAEVLDLIAAGTLPALEAGGRTRIDREAVDAFRMRNGNGKLFL